MTILSRWRLNFAHFWLLWMAGSFFPLPAVCATNSNAEMEFTYKIVNQLPHDPEAFTQGLVFHNGKFYEGTGLNGKSTLKRNDPDTGKTLLRSNLPEKHFGEGITIVSNEIFQLTWKSGICFVYDLKDFKELRRHTYQGEGWGLTTDGTHLIMSDGTTQLRFLDPKTFKEVRTIQVVGPQGPLRGLNELEFIEGEIWSNVWPTDFIIRIDPKNGQIRSVISFAGLAQDRELYRGENVLNGIAYDTQGKRVFVTGKYWPKIYQIELVPAPRSKP